MSNNQNWTTATDAAAFFQQTEKRLGMEERRQRVTKASDLLGPLFGPSAILLSDSLDSDLFVFNGLFVVQPATVSSPDATVWWMGESIAQEGIGGVQILYTFKPADAPHRMALRGWATVAGSGGLRAYSPWEISYLTGSDTTAWVSPALSNSWVSYDGGATYDVPMYRRYNGVVYLKGLMKSGTPGTTVFTLPVGFRPTGQRRFVVSATTGVARATVYTTGVVAITGYDELGDNAYVSLDQIIFVAEA